MCPPLPGQRINVTFLKCNGTPEMPISNAPDETEVLVRGRICVPANGSWMMVKARIKDLLDKLLPGYKGTFRILDQLLNVDSNEKKNELKNIYVRLLNFYLGTPSQCTSSAMPVDHRKRKREESPEERESHCQPAVSHVTCFPIRSSGRTTVCVPTNTGANGKNDAPPSKKSRKDVWQTDSADPMDILRGLISKHLHGFVSAPGLTHSAKEIAMSAYFDWLDNVTPKHPGHLVIVGNPGVGKTTGAWALAKFLAEAGIVRSENIVEAHRDDLIDRYVGGTELKTNIVIQSARGGVVILDEIYALNKPSSPNDSGKEALTTIMKYMTKPAAPVFMFLGYKKQMTDFVNMNPGFQRRIKYIIEMQDYTPSSLAQIAKIKMEEMALQLEEGIELEPFFHGIRPEYLKLRNASVAVSLIGHALSHARKRTLQLPPNQRKGASRILLREDLDAALTIIREESKRNGGPDDDYGVFI